MTYRKDDSQPHAVIAAYKAAYLRANGGAPEITFLRGYYTINKGFRYRLTEVLRMKLALLARKPYDPSNK